MSLIHLLCRDINMLNRVIPSSGETIPVIGSGTWQAFDKTSAPDLQCLAEVLKTMHTNGGRLIDSSPMYGMSEQTAGLLTQQSAYANNFFYATKVWTTGKNEGTRQMEDSMRKMQRTTMDLIQVHNLVDWRTQLETLKEWKAEGKVRYIGITHYLDEMHEELEKIISTTEIDFVQFNYSITARNAENRLLPAAMDRGVATVINRPLDVGKLFGKVKDKLLPAWCADHGIYSWAQYFLKYLISHPGVTCVIPATANPAHMADNMKAGHDIITDKKVLDKMVHFITTL